MCKVLQTESSETRYGPAHSAGPHSNLPEGSKRHIVTSVAATRALQLEYADWWRHLPNDTWRTTQRQARDLCLNLDQSSKQNRNEICFFIIRNCNYEWSSFNTFHILPCITLFLGNSSQCAFVFSVLHCHNQTNPLTKNIYINNVYCILFLFSISNHYFHFFLLTQTPSGK